VKKDVRELTVVAKESKIGQKKYCDGGPGALSGPKGAEVQEGLILNWVKKGDYQNKGVGSRGSRIGVKKGGLS